MQRTNMSKLQEYLEAIKKSPLLTVLLDIANQTGRPEVVGDAIRSALVELRKELDLSAEDYAEILKRLK